MSQQKSPLICLNFVYRSLGTALYFSLANQILRPLEKELSFTMFVEYNSLLQSSNGEHHASINRADILSRTGLSFDKLNFRFMGLSRPKHDWVVCLPTIRGCEHEIRFGTSSAPNEEASVHLQTIGVWLQFKWNANGVIAVYTRKTTNKWFTTMTRVFDMNFTPRYRCGFTINAQMRSSDMKDSCYWFSLLYTSKNSRVGEPKPPSTL